MKLSELLAFVTVVETGNITQAAERLNRVQSSISHRIRSLEDNLDVTLLDRKTDGCSLTAQGQILYDYALKILNLADDCKNNISHSKNSQLNMRIGIIECLPPYIVSSLIDLGHDLGWNIDISIGNTISLLNAFDQNEFDAVIIGAGFSNTQHARSILLSSELVIITEKNYPTIKDISSLDGEVFLLSSKKCATTTRNYNVLFNEGHITPKRVVECGSYPVLFSSIAAGKGVSLVLRCSISGEVQNKIKIHELSGQFNDFKIELVYRTDSPYLDSTKFRGIMTSLFQDPRLHNIGY
ncbi:MULTISPECIES: LysR family transcriptional regulator [Rahnella]|jgi:DNA-binding transcriptional LysR family regulator|uniref:LysR family transcriptional regulator n=1 Tax=Rahnella TaxID=34037 RepID=UPI000569318B|nr:MULTISPECIES: LysR family transcriptional regulator [Rahnella]AYA06689.1 LysR family transcriptional regulator [Rahnella aquatilis]AZP41932.1 LysR family transcriptional regulator [Rahnella aquatilis]AZP46273.1 LysR family transcriptional regulator [Rahnella aquatilis]AZP50746.1 LysR family transcriptional regulator [Rahnella aquatilis]MBU9852693.1 LysR family transcriptional regulator [Rahnella aceris]